MAATSRTSREARRQRGGRAKETAQARDATSGREDRHGDDDDRAGARVNGLDVLVARDEGLFAAEGLDLRIAALAPGEIRSTAEGTLRQPVTNQGKLQERGDAAMFQG